jgi:hypothetical protein
LDTYEVSKDTSITNIKALRLNIASPFKVPFIVAENHLKFQGSLITKTEKTTVCMLSCASFNIRTFFGKGFESIKDFASSLKTDKTENCEFSVKMFSKQLYGRMPSHLSEGSYGYWEISMIYEDELPGRTKHSPTNCITFSSESFFVGVELEGHLVYVFQVGNQDFL